MMFYGKSIYTFRTMPPSSLQQNQSSKCNQCNKQHCSQGGCYNETVDESFLAVFRSLKLDVLAKVVTSVKRGIEQLMPDYVILSGFQGLQYQTSRIESHLMITVSQSQGEFQFCVQCTLSTIGNTLFLYFQISMKSN